MEILPAYECIFYASFTFIYLASYLKETSQDTAAKFEKHGYYGHKTFGGRFKYATFLNLIIYFSICTMNSLYEMSLLNNAGKNESLRSIRNNNYMRKFCNFLFTSYIFPCGVFVAVQFWVVYSINRQLIFPKVFEKILPGWHNHVVHTLPMVSSVLDNLITQHYYPASFILGAFIPFSTSIIYLTWTLIILKIGGFWTYPYIKHLKTTHRMIFFLGSIILNLMIYQVEKAFNSFIWERNVSER